MHQQYQTPVFRDFIDNSSLFQNHIIYGHIRYEKMHHRKENRMIGDFRSIAQGSHADETSGYCIVLVVRIFTAAGGRRAMLVGHGFVHGDCWKYEKVAKIILSHSRLVKLTVFIITDEFQTPGISLLCTNLLQVPMYFTLIAVDALLNGGPARLLCQHHGYTQNQEDLHFDK